MSDEEAREAAAAWIDMLTARYAREEFEEADQFVVVIVDPTLPKTYVHGPTGDVVEALRWASEHEADLTKGAAPDEEPYEVFVRPLQPMT